VSAFGARRRPTEATAQFALPGPSRPKLGKTSRFKLTFEQIVSFMTLLHKGRILWDIFAASSSLTFRNAQPQMNAGCSVPRAAFSCK